MPELMMDMIVNGRRVTKPAQPHMRLLDYLRDELNLTGSKEGCGAGLVKCPLQNIEIAVLGQAFDRFDGCAIGLGNRHQAGLHQLAIDKDRARAQNGNVPLITSRAISTASKILL